MPNIDWNASDYQKHFSFVPSYGESVMELLTKPEGAFVVDLGCGNGMLTKKLAEKRLSRIGSRRFRNDAEAGRKKLLRDFFSERKCG